MRKKIFNSCTWAVAYKIDKDTQDDKKTGAEFPPFSLTQATRKIL